MPTHPVKRFGFEVLGWTLIVAGIAALVLPGPGMLMLLAGLVVLSQSYAWAEKWVHPVKEAALRGASNGVQTWPRIALSLSGVCGLVGVGVLWGVRPPAPSWWPVEEKWWLFGGWGTAATLLVSAAIALGLLVYSFRRFRTEPYRGGHDRGESPDHVPEPSGDRP